jgi:hypothetical protein
LQSDALSFPHKPQVILDKYHLLVALLHRKELQISSHQR